jgi:epsilon-lactone hydrolase
VPVAVFRSTLWALRRFVFNPAVPVRQQRARQELALRLLVHAPRDTRLERSRTGGVGVLRVTAPDVAPDRLIVHLHGGGFCIGSPTMARGYAAALSSITRAAVLVPDYRLAPEHPYPAAVEDVTSIWDAIAAETPTAQVALSGDSAGAALALVTTLRLRDAGRPGPLALGLISPLLDLTAPRSAGPGDPLLSREWLAWCGRAYAAGRPLADPEISPLLADLHGVPPTMIVSATHELLADDARRFTDTVHALGGFVQAHAEDLWHDFPLQTRTLAAADSATRRIGEFISSAWR